MKDTILISAFPGTGKTYFTNNTELDVLDSDSSNFNKEAGGREFPENYINHIKNNLGKVDIILISSHEEVLYELEKEKIGYNLVYPDKELKEEYIQRYKEREDSDVFISLLETNWDEWQNYMEWETGCRHIVLESGEYLTDRIDECKTYNPGRWTVKGREKNGNTLRRTIGAETKEEATKLFLEKSNEYLDIIYVRPSGRYSYSTTGYGIFSALGYYYASGRIEVYDREDWSGYAIDEGSYWVPLKDEGRLRDFFDDLETTDPLYIKIGNFEACQKAVSDETGIPVDKLNDREEVKKLGDKRHQEYLDSLSKEDKEYLENKFGKINKEKA